MPKRTEDEMDDERSARAAELTAQIVSARVGAAAGRPNATEGRDLVEYIRLVHAEMCRAIGLSEEDETP